MGKKQEGTPNSRITSALRLLSMRSRERQDALREAKRTCARCGRRHSTAKGKECQVQAHHKRPPVWKRVHDVVREEILQDKTAYEPLCKECHAEETKKQREEKRSKK